MGYNSKLHIINNHQSELTGFQFGCSLGRCTLIPWKNGRDFDGLRLVLSSIDGLSEGEN